jgi:hypothetical protein
MTESEERSTWDSEFGGGTYVDGSTKAKSRAGLLEGDCVTRGLRDCKNAVKDWKMGGGEVGPDCFLF